MTWAILSPFPVNPTLWRSLKFKCRHSSSYVQCLPMSYVKQTLFYSLAWSVANGSMVYLWEEEQRICFLHPCGTNVSNRHLGKRCRARDESAFPQSPSPMRRTRWEHTLPALWNGRPKNSPESCYDLFYRRRKWTPGRGYHVDHSGKVERCGVWRKQLQCQIQNSSTAQVILWCLCRKLQQVTQNDFLGALGQLS